MKANDVKIQHFLWGTRWSPESTNNVYQLKGEHCTIFPRGNDKRYVWLHLTSVKKAPDNVILHVGTNDAPNSISRAILDSMLTLKSFIEKTLPKSKVCISFLVKRTGNGKATLTVNKVNEHLSALQLDIVDNANINVTSLNRGGLHLNKTGTGKLAVNFIKKIKSFKREWQVTSSSSNKYSNFCPINATYSLGKQRNENLDKTLSEQKKNSSASGLSHEKGLDKLNVGRS